MVRTKAEAKRTKDGTGSSRVPKKDGGSKNPKAEKLKATKAKLKPNSTKKGRLVAKKPSSAKTTDADDSSEPRIKVKKRKQKAFREIRKEQDCRDRPSTLKPSRAIPYASFKRCVKDILRDMSGTGPNAVTSISPKAISILKADAEEHMRRVYSLAAAITASRKAIEVTHDDLRFSNNIFMNPHILCERGGTERIMKKSVGGRKLSSVTEKKEVDSTPAPKETPKESTEEKEKPDEVEDEKMNDEEEDKDEVFEDAE